MARCSPVLVFGEPFTNLDISNIAVHGRCAENEDRGELCSALAKVPVGPWTVAVPLDAVPASGRKDWHDGRVCSVVYGVSSRTNNATVADAPHSPAHRGT